jgi:flagellar P-ring protein precursor FlgI
MAALRILGAILCVALAGSAAANEVRLKDLGRFLGWRDNMLVGYGLVTGLSGSGDSPRSRVTRQTLANVLSQFNLSLSDAELQSRNVAAVMVTAVLPPSGNVGDKIDVNVTSIGDARSLSGGVLLMTTVMGPDRQVYALAQGPLSTGGYRFDYNGNVALKNSPTSAIVPGGATIERPVTSSVVAGDGSLTFVLKDPDVTTAQRIAERVTSALQGGYAVARDASSVYIVPAAGAARNANALLASIENLRIAPDRMARVVINERTGTVVAGANVQISAIAISHGDIRVSVQTEFSASQPTLIQPIIIGDASSGVRSLVIANSRLEVAEGTQTVTATFPNTTVADLVQGLAKLRVSTRDMIAILQAIKASGAMYAELVVQ